MDPYKTLNISQNASPPEIKKAYFRLVRKYPPEKEPEKFKTIRHAYEQIKSTPARVKTDFSILKEPAGSFILPPEADNPDSYFTEVTFTDFLIAVEYLFSDLYKTDFSEDYSTIKPE